MTPEELAAQQAAAEAAAQAAAAKQFTQADLDRVAGERAARAKEAADKKALAEYGADAKTVKEQLAKLAALEAAQKTDAERQADALKSAQAAIAQTAQEAAQARQDAARAMLERDVYASCPDMQPGAAEAIMLAVSKAKSTAPDAALADLIKQARTAQPYLFRGAVAELANMGGDRPPVPGERTTGLKSANDLTPAEFETARARLLERGRL